MPEAGGRIDERLSAGFVLEHGPQRSRRRSGALRARNGEVTAEEVADAIWKLHEAAISAFKEYAEEAQMRTATATLAED